MVTQLADTFWNNFKRAKEVRDLSFEEISEITGLSTTNLTTSVSNGRSVTLKRGFTLAKGVGENLMVLLGADREQTKLVFPENEEEAVENYWNNIDSLEKGETKEKSRYQVLKAIKRPYRRDFVSGTSTVTFFWLDEISEAYSWEAYELLCRKAK